MIKNLDEFTAVLDKLDISADEFLFCYLVFNQEWELAARYYRKSRKDIFNREMVTRLIRKKLIINSGSKVEPEYHFDYLQVTDRFIRSVSGDVDAREYYDLYPAEIYVKGNPYLGRNIPFSDFKVIYNQLIGSSSELHERMMEVLSWTVENNELHVGMKKWLDLELYKHMEKKMIEENEPGDSI